MSFGDGDLHVQVAQLKTENARLKQRVRELEALLRWVNGRWEYMKSGDEWEFEERMAALGIEVDT